MTMAKNANVLNAGTDRERVCQGAAVMLLPGTIPGSKIDQFLPEGKVLSEKWTWLVVNYHMQRSSSDLSRERPQLL